MTAQLAKHSPFYAAVAVVCFLVGWHVNARLSTYGDEFDYRIEGRYGW